MNTKFFIGIIFASIILANGLRVLGEAERAIHDYQSTLVLNGDEVITEGTLHLQENYICIKPGSVANSAVLNKIPNIDGRFCFPYVDFKYIDNNFSKLRKVLLFNIYSIENSKLSDNIRVEIVFTGGVDTETLEKMFEVINQDMTDVKIKAKALSAVIFAASDEYNALVVRYATGNKSRPEIEAEIVENQKNIDATEDELNRAKIRFNDNQADCTTSDAAREDALSQLRNKRAKLENLNNTIFNNRQSIKSYEEGIYNKEKAVAACQKVRDGALDTCNSMIKTLKEKIPSETADLDEVDTEIKAPFKGTPANTRIGVVNKLIDGFVNVSS